MDANTKIDVIRRTNKFFFIIDNQLFVVALFVLSLGQSTFLNIN
jgi:uncharacterized membrane-anchored protein